MEIRQLQNQINHSIGEMKTPFRSGTEIMLALTEELGEIATEVALLEQVGSKTEWSKSPSEGNLGEEIMHTINLLFALANQFDIDVAQVYEVYHQDLASKT
ncbi:hypothetical protein ACFLXI_08595 [Chloroflexota bacterium]